MISWTYDGNKIGFKMGFNHNQYDSLPLNTNIEHRPESMVDVGDKHTYLEQWNGCLKFRGLDYLLPVMFRFVRTCILSILSILIYYHYDDGQYQHLSTVLQIIASHHFCSKVSGNKALQSGEHLNCQGNLQYNIGKRSDLLDAIWDFQGTCFII